MTDYDALYAAILDRPEDDTPRLVLADWCDDHGDPERAEFIRVQVELARTWADHSDLSHQGTSLCDGCNLRRRERELSEGCKQSWFPTPSGGEWSWHLQEWQNPTYHIGWVVRRGFVSEVRLSLAAFVGEGCDCSDAIGGWGCPTCQNTTRVPGLARELFAAHPITRVSPPDPISHYDYVAGEWCFEPGAGYRCIPAEIHDRLAGYARLTALGRWKVYTAEADALTALSDACVVYGRELAGLRPLTVGGRPA